MSRLVMHPCVTTFMCHRIYYVIPCFIVTWGIVLDISDYWWCWWFYLQLYRFIYLPFYTYDLCMYYGYIRLSHKINDNLFPHSIPNNNTGATNHIDIHIPFTKSLPKLRTYKNLFFNYSLCLSICSRYSYSFSYDNGYWNVLHAS